MLGWKAKNEHLLRPVSPFFMDVSAEFPRDRYCLNSVFGDFYEKSAEKNQISFRSSQNVGWFIRRPNRVSYVLSDPFSTTVHTTYHWACKAKLSIFVTLLTAIYVCQQCMLNVLLFFHINSGYANMPRWYMIRWLSILFSLFPRYYR